MTGRCSPGADVSNRAGDYCRSPGPTCSGRAAPGALVAYWSSQCTEEIADIRNDGFWLVPGAVMSSGCVMPLLLEVVVALRPAARCTGELRRQNRDASRSFDRGHAPMHRRPRVVRGFIVVTRGRAIALRDP